MFSSVGTEVFFFLSGQENFDIWMPKRKGRIQKENTIIKFVFFFSIFLPGLKSSHS